MSSTTGTGAVPTTAARAIFPTTGAGTAKSAGEDAMCSSMGAGNGRHFRRWSDVLHDRCRRMRSALIDRCRCSVPNWPEEIYSPTGAGAAYPPWRRRRNVLIPRRRSTTRHCMAWRNLLHEKCLCTHTASAASTGAMCPTTGATATCDVPDVMYFKTDAGATQDAAVATYSIVSAGAT